MTVKPSLATMKIWGVEIEPGVVALAGATASGKSKTAENLRGESDASAGSIVMCEK